MSASARGIFQPQPTEAGPGFEGPQLQTLLARTAPPAIGTAGARGDAPRSAREDHTHAYAHPTQWVNASAYGVKGTGVSHPLVAAEAADFNARYNIGAAAGDEWDWAALQSAVSHAANGTAITLSPGHYLLNRALTFATKDGVSLVGAGWEQTFLRMTSATADLLSLSNTSYCTIRDLQIRPKAGLNRTAGAAIRILGGTFPTVEHVIIRTPWDGVVITDTVGDGTGAACQHPYIHDVRICESAETGFHEGIVCHHTVGLSLNRVRAMLPSVALS